jgi:archaellin
VVADTGGLNVTGIVVPLKTLGVRYVPMSSPESEVTCRIENVTIFADMYNGIDTGNPAGENLTVLVTNTTENRAELFIGNSDSDSSLDYDEKGYVVLKLDPVNAAAEREHVFIEVRPERGAPLSMEFIVPSELIVGWSTIGA